MKLYMHPGSPNSRRARLAARLSGVDVEEVMVDVAAGDNRKPDYLALNPMGKVPTLVDAKGHAVLESYAIGFHLGQGTPLVPADRVADVLRWQFFDACHFAGPLGTLTFQHMFAPEPDAGVVEGALKDWRRYAAVLEAALEPGGHVLGTPEPTLADVALAASLTYAEPSQVPLDDYPRMQAWRASLEQLPAFRETSPPRPG